MDQNSSITKIINICVTCPENRFDDPFSVLCSFQDFPVVLELISSYLSKVKDPNVKSRISTLYQLYMLNFRDKVLLDDQDFVINQIFVLTSETPMGNSTNHFLQFQQVIEVFLKSLKESSYAKLFNKIVTVQSPYAPLALMVVSRNAAKLYPSLIRFLVSMIKDLNMVAFYSLSCFVNELKVSQIQTEALSELNLDIIKTSIISALNLKSQYKQTASELIGALFKFLDNAQASDLANSLLTSLLFLLKDGNSAIRSSIVSSLCFLPVFQGNQEFQNQALLTALFPPICQKFEECDDDFGESVLNFAFSRRMVSTLPSVIKMLVESKETYLAGVCIAARLGLFPQSEPLLLACFPEKPSPRVAFAALQATCVLCKYKLLDEPIFPVVLRSLMQILSSPQLLDDLIIQIRAFQTLENLKDVAPLYPTRFFDEIIKHLPKLKENDVMIHLSNLLSVVIKQETKSLTQVSAQQFAELFTPVMMRYIETNDIEQQSKYLNVLCIVSAAGFGKPVSALNGSSELVDLIDQLVPSHYADAVRTDAIFQMQQRPYACLIAASLPGNSPFLPSLARVVRELVPPDPILTMAFMKNASKRSLESFLPHLQRFTEPFETSNSFLFVSIKHKHQNHIKEVFQCISYIASNLDSSSNVLNLLSIAEMALSETKNIESCVSESKKAFEDLSRINNLQWPSSLLNKLFSIELFSPLFYVLIPHSPVHEVSLVDTVACSYIQHLSKNPVFGISNVVAVLQNETNDKQSLSKTEFSNNYLFIDSIFKLSDNLSTITCIIKRAIAVLSIDDPLPVLDLCNLAAKKYLSTHDSIDINTNDFIVASCSFPISTSPPLRVMIRNTLMTLFNLNLPIESSSPLFLAESSLSPVEVVSFATSLYNSIFSQIPTQNAISLALFASSTRPLNFHHALLLKTLSVHQGSAIVTDQKRAINRFFEGADASEAESRSLLLDAAKQLFLCEKNGFLQSLLSSPLTKFGVELISSFVRVPEFRSSFFESYGYVISNIKFPSSPKEQTDFLSAGYFQVLSVIIESDSSSGVILGTFGSLVAHVLTWLSLLYTSSSSIPKSIGSQLSQELVKCLEIIFSRLGRSSHEPIEFSFKNPKSLYQSLGTLSNSLLMVDFSLLIDFCRECFSLIKSHIPQTSLTASMCLSRLLFRVSGLDSEASRKLAPKLRETISYAFSVVCDENCRLLSAVMNDLFTRQILSQFDGSDIEKMIKGSIRGVSFPSEDLRTNNIAFLSKMITVANEETLSPLYDRLWDLLLASQLSPIVIDAITRIISYEKNSDRINPQLTAKLFLNSTIDDPSISKRCRKLFLTMCQTSSFDEIFTRLPDVLGKSKYIQIRTIIAEKINKTNATVSSLDLLIKLHQNGSQEPEYRNQIISLLMTILDDSEHVLRKHASSILPGVIAK